MSRSLLLFESAIKTEATKKQYTFYLKQFLTYAKLDDPEYYAQEYNCEFVVPSDSLFGKLESKNISNEFKPILL